MTGDVDDAVALGVVTQLLIDAEKERDAERASNAAALSKIDERLATFQELSQKFGALEATVQRLAESAPKDVTIQVEALLSEVRSMKAFAEVRSVAPKAKGAKSGPREIEITVTGRDANDRIDNATIRIA